MAEKKVISDEGHNETAVSSTPEAPLSEKSEELEVEQAVVTEEEIEVVEEVVVETSVAALFEGLDLSEEFKTKVTVVFEAAVNEAVEAKTSSLHEEISEKLETELQESVDSKVEEIVENLDKYLDYVVEQWMDENEIAIEAGIKVEMAESLLDGLKSLFNEHNVEIDDETFDVVTGLEEEVASLKDKSNELVNENIELKQAIHDAQAVRVFDEIAENMTVSQQERFKVLSENLSKDDLDAYKTNLETIKESFFGEAQAATKVDTNIVSEEEIITEEAEVKSPASEHHSVNALVEALNARKATA